MKIIIIFLTAFVFTGCLKIKDKSQKIEEAEPVKDLSVSAEVIATPAPNAYQVRLSVPGQIQVIQRTDISDSSLQYLDLNLENGFFVDLKPVAGRSYKYEMGFIEDGHFHSQVGISVSIPEDLVIQGQMTLNQDTMWSYSRIYFLKDSLLRTQQYSLNIQADQIISEAGTIETFPSTGSDPAQGRSGGSILVNTKTAMGNLTIVMRGENGAMGAEGLGESCAYRMSGKHAEDGGPGKDGGNSGQFNIYISGSHSLNLNAVISAGLAGPGGPGGTTCSAFPKRPLPGAPGRSGQVQQSLFQDSLGARYY